MGIPHVGPRIRHRRTSTAALAPTFGPKVVPPTPSMRLWWLILDNTSLSNAITTIMLPEQCKSLVGPARRGQGTPSFTEVAAYNSSYATSPEGSPDPRALEGNLSRSASGLITPPFLDRSRSLGPLRARTRDVGTETPRFGAQPRADTAHGHISNA
jgi:hypothetical protein